MRKELELYEILFLLDPNFTEKELEDKISFYQNFLTAQGSKVMVQNQGRKTLSTQLRNLRRQILSKWFFLGTVNCWILLLVH